MLRLAREVAEALAEDRPVVALETSIVAQGLPFPQNRETAHRCEQAIRSAGAVPATTAVIAGELRVGLEEAEIDRLARERAASKVSARDLGPAIARRSDGSTTVAATVRLAGLCGIRFLATGGIGGVHRGHPDDVSADLEEIARTEVAVFCAGAKIILDLPLTVERLETLGVPVIGFRSDEFPGFYVARTGLRCSARADSAEAVAAFLAAGWAAGARGHLVAVPPPSELEGAEALVARALADTADVTGAAVTPAQLARIAELSGGRSVAVNVELAVNNARVAAEAAVAHARRRA
jgi:pseudouridylate synthase